MQRLYFVTHRLEDTERISTLVHEAGISDWNFHVVGKDEAGMIGHRIHSATLYQQLDIVHSGERFAIFYGLAGLVLASVLTALGLSPVAPPAVFIAATTLLTAMFGAWTGGLIGLSRENYKLAPFHDDIEAGRFVVMIDVKEDQRSRIREIINMNVPGAQSRGRDTTIVNPFVKPKRIFERAT